MNCTMADITINSEGCKACMLCMTFCPRDCLAPGEDLNSRGFHPVALVKPERCTGCRICAMMCPDLCIEVYRTGAPSTELTPQAEHE